MNKQCKCVELLAKLEEIAVGPRDYGPSDDYERGKLAGLAELAGEIQAWLDEREEDGE